MALTESVEHLFEKCGNWASFLSSPSEWRNGTENTQTPDAKQQNFLSRLSARICCSGNRGKRFYEAPYRVQGPCARTQHMIMATLCSTLPSKTEMFINFNVHYVCSFAINSMPLIWFHHFLPLCSAVEFSLALCRCRCAPLLGPFF